MDKSHKQAFYVRKNTFDDPSIGGRVDQQNFLYIVGRSVNCYDCFGKVWYYLGKLNIHIPYNPVILLDSTTHV